MQSKPLDLYIDPESRFSLVYKSISLGSPPVLQKRCLAPSMSVAGGETNELLLSGVKTLITTSKDIVKSSLMHSCV